VHRERFIRRALSYSSLIVIARERSPEASLVLSNGSPEKGRKEESESPTLTRGRGGDGGSRAEVRRSRRVPHKNALATRTPDARTKPDRNLPRAFSRPVLPPPRVMIYGVQRDSATGQCRVPIRVSRNADLFPGIKWPGRCRWDSREPTS